MVLDPENAYGAAGSPEFAQSYPAGICLGPSALSRKNFPRCWGSNFSAQPETKRPEPSKNSRIVGPQ